MKRILLLTLGLLMLASASFGADSVATLHVTGTEEIAEPVMTTPYVPPQYDDEGNETVAETKGVMTFPAVSGTNYKFATATDALDFARNPQVYIEGHYTGYIDTYEYDTEYDESLKATMSTVEITIETSEIPETVDTTSYSAITTINFTANPRTLTSPYGERHFIAGSSSTVTFSGITFSGTDGGGVEVRDGTVTFTSCTFTVCDASENGGAILVSGGTVSATNCAFTNNTATSGNGGAVAVTGGSMTLEGASFTGNNATNGGAVYSSSGLTVGAGTTFNTAGASSPNTAERGGAIYIAGGTATVGAQVGFTGDKADYGGAIYAASGTLNVTGEAVTFTDNEAVYDGGALWTGSGSRVSFTGASLELSTNKAVSGDGGGIYVSANSTVTLSGSGTAFTGNTAEYSKGGAVFMAGGSTVNLSGAMTFSGNTAGNGGAVYMANARNATSLNITGTEAVTFGQNDADTSGGAIYAETNCNILLEPEITFTGNQARNGNGGALWLAEAGQLPEGTVIFSGNHANKSTASSSTEGSGGAIYVEGSDSSSAIIGTTRLYTFVDGNTAMSYGGAFCSNSGDVTFEGYTSGDAITSRNSAYLGGGFAASYAGTIRVSNSTICNQVATRGSGGAIWAKNVVVTSADFGAEGSPNESQGTGNNNGGGAIYSSGSISLSNATFSYNTAIQGGGAVYADTADVSIRGCYFHHNNAQGGNGGAVTLRNYCTTSVASTTFTENQSENLDGGAVYAQGRIDISYCYFNTNLSKRSGGAIYFDQSNAQEPFSSFTVSNTMFYDNSTLGGTEGGYGGGIFVASNRATITSCTFAKNHIDLSGNSGEGGGLYLNTSLYQTAVNRIENCTFYENSVNDGASPSSDNTSYSGGGGLSVHCEGRTDVVSCTFALNASRYKGGAIYLGLEDGTLILSGTIAVGNTSAGIYDIWSDGNISSGGYNRVGVYGTGSGVTDFYSETRNETDRTSYPSKGWTKSTFFSGNVLAVNERTDLGGDIPPYIGSVRAGQERLLTLMLSEDATLPLTDRATNVIPYSRRTSFPNVDERGVSRVSGNEEIALDIGACFFDGTRFSPKPSPISSYTIGRVEISGIPNNLRRVGQTASLIAKVYYTNGRTALGGYGDGEEPIEWTSDKPNIIRINKDTGDITVLNFTPGETYVTITATTIRTDINGARISDSKPIKVTEYTYSYLNTTPELMDYLQGYTEQLTEYDIAVSLADRDSSAVSASSFQTSFADIWGDVTVSQVTDLTTDNLTFGTATSYNSSDGYELPSGKAGVNVILSGVNEGVVFPLTYSWTFSGSELKSLLGYDLSGREISASLADSIFTSLRIDFEGNGYLRPVIGGDGVSAGAAMSAGALSLTKSDGGRGLHAELTAYLANVSASGANQGSQIVGGLLVVPDGDGTDGSIRGTMWMADKPGASDKGQETGGNAQSSGGGGGGCEAVGVMMLLPVILMTRRKK